MKRGKSFWCASLRTVSYRLSRHSAGTGFPSQAVHLLVPKPLSLEPELRGVKIDLGLIGYQGAV